MAENLATEVKNKEIKATEERIERNSLIRDYRQSIYDAETDKEAKNKLKVSIGEANKVIEDDKRYLAFLKA